MWVVDFRYIDTKISALFASMTLVYKEPPGASTFGCTGRLTYKLKVRDRALRGRTFRHGDFFRTVCVICKGRKTDEKLIDGGFMLLLLNVLVISF